MSESITRLIRILEAMSDMSAKGLSTTEVIERSGLASSTAYRMVGELESAGYIYRTEDRKLHPNFSFERRIAAGRISPAELWTACADISNALEASSEVILLRGQNLLWHITDEHPLQPIRLRAHPGYIRGTYELDSISRLALAHMPIEHIERSWDKTAFFDVGVNAHKLAWAEVRSKLAAVDINQMEFDIQGNAKGVRRFCVAVTEADRHLVCLLTVAEAAVPLRDEAAHVEQIKDVLMYARKRLVSGLLKQQEKFPA